MAMPRFTCAFKVTHDGDWMCTLTVGEDTPSLDADLMVVPGVYTGSGKSPELALSDALSDYTMFHGTYALLGPHADTR